MNNTKMNAVIVFVSMFLIIILIRLSGGYKRVNNAISYSEKYALNNNERMKDLELIALEQNLINDSITKTVLDDMNRPVHKLSVYVSSKGKFFKKSINTPNFYSNFFLGNQSNGIEITKDGITVMRLFKTFSGKNCSIKYFLKPHLLQDSLVYSKMPILKKGEKGLDTFCYLINDNWILMVK